MKRKQLQTTNRPGTELKEHRKVKCLCVHKGGGAVTGMQTGTPGGLPGGGELSTQISEKVTGTSSAMYPWQGPAVRAWGASESLVCYDRGRGGGHQPHRKPQLVVGKLLLLFSGNKRFGEEGEGALKGFQMGGPSAQACSVPPQSLCSTF